MVFQRPPSLRLISGNTKLGHATASTRQLRLTTLWTPSLLEKTVVRILPALKQSS